MERLTCGLSSLTRGGVFEAKSPELPVDQKGSA